MTKKNAGEGTAPTTVKGDHWIKLPGAPGTPLAEVQAMLAPFGITMSERQSMSCVVYRGVETNVLMKEVGEVIVRENGAVLVSPRADASDQEAVALLQAGELACREKPSRLTGWERRFRRGTGWWQHTLLLTIDERDPYWWAYRTAEVPSQAAARETAAIAVGT